jgi:hypothetical protein
LVDVGHGTEQEFSAAGNIAGKILLVHTDEMKVWADLFAEYLHAPEIIDRAVRAKALAIAFQSTRPYDLLYRHTNSTKGEIDQLPMVMVAREDAGRMARLLASGQKLFADLAIPNQVGGPIKAPNVIAELRGTEKPDEFVILGAHLDSWELGTGALDNGCNAALVVMRYVLLKRLDYVRDAAFGLFCFPEKSRACWARTPTPSHTAMSWTKLPASSSSIQERAR